MNTVKSIKSTPDWTSLPEHLLCSIAKRLHTRIDILHFRAVCRSFRSTLPPPPKTLLFPESVLKKTDFLMGPNPDDHDLFVLTESTVYAIEPLNKTSNGQGERSQTWLVQVKESNPGRVQIKDALSGFRFTNLPKKLLNLLDYRVTEISKSYALELAAIHKGKAKLFDFYNEIKSRSSFGTAKVIFSSFLDETDDNFAVMAKFGDKTLRVWRNVDKKWTNIDMDLKFPRAFIDIICRNHKFYTFTSGAVTVIIETKSLTIVEVPYPADREALWSLHLVETLKDIFLIAWYYWDQYNDNRDYNFMVFKLDEERREWVQVVDGLEDRVFFVGGRSSFSISAKEFSGYKGNCIYFTSYKGGKEDDRGREVWIFDLQDQSVEKLVAHPNLFRPPPTWLEHKYSF